MVLIVLFLLPLSWSQELRVDKVKLTEEWLKHCVDLAKILLGFGLANVLWDSHKQRRRIQDAARELEDLWAAWRRACLHLNIALTVMQQGMDDRDTAIFTHGTSDMKTHGSWLLASARSLRGCEGRNATCLTTRLMQEFEGVPSTALQTVIEGIQSRRINAMGKLAPDDHQAFKAIREYCARVDSASGQALKEKE